MTGRFLRSTGQVVGGEGLSRWVVQACDCTLCSSGRFIATDESSEFGEDDDDRRHINVGNLEVVRTTPSRKETR